MAGLAVQNFVSAAVGMAVLVAFIRGFAARSGRELGNFWQDIDPRRLLYILLPLSFIGRADPGLPGRDPDARAATDAHDARRRRADARARARPRRRSRSSSSAPTAAASSTSTRRSRSRTRPVLELRRDALHPADPGRADRDVRPHGRQPAPGLGALRRDGSMMVVAPSASPTPRAARLAGACSRPASTGGNLEGKEQRFGIASTATGPRSRPPPRTAR